MRAKVREGRDIGEIGQAILAAWYKILPEQEGDPIGDIDADELTTLFNQILETPCQAIVDPKSGPINIAVPQPPETVTSRQSLVEYLADFVPETPDPTYHSHISVALLFGCGK